MVEKMVCKRRLFLTALGRPTRGSAAALCLLCVLGLAAPVAGNGETGRTSVPSRARVSLGVSTAEVYANEPLTVTIRVEDFSECEPPVFPDIPDCTVRPLMGGMDSTQTFIVNGRMTVSRSRTYSFELTAGKPGELTIPPVQVVVDGRPLETEPVRISVRPSDAAELFWVEVSSPRQRIYVGQRVTLTMTIWVKPARVQGRRLSSRDMMNLLRGEFGPFPSRLRTDTRSREGPDGTSEVYYTYESTTAYLPDRPGLLSLENVEIGLHYPTRFSRDVFGELHVAAYRPLRARPSIPPLEVLPLPADGRPPNFTGAVGTYNIIVTAKPLSVRVGDPIELTIEIRGDGPIETLPPPNLAADPRLTAAFRIPREELAGEVRGSSRLFTQIIRADSADVSEIPAIEYPYFDPDREMYVVALSEPIPLRVIPAPELVAADLTELTRPRDTPSATALRVLDGLRGNETREARLLAHTTTVSMTSLAVATGLPPILFLLAWGSATYVRHHGPVQRRRASARRQARRRLEHARHLPPREAAAQIAAALSGYLAERLGEPVARFTGAAAVDQLVQRGVCADVAQRWRHVMQRCEQTSFGGVLDGDMATLVRQALECLRAVERERL